MKPNRSQNLLYPILDCVVKVEKYWRENPNAADVNAFRVFLNPIVNELAKVGNIMSEKVKLELTGSILRLELYVYSNERSELITINKPA